MSDTNAIQIIKRAAINAVEASKPCDITAGVVISVEPVSIQTDQKILLEEEFIVIPEKLTDYEMEISFVDGEVIQGACMRASKDAEEVCGAPECSGCSGYPGGGLAEPGGAASWSRQEIRFSPPVRHKLIIHNALKEGDIVIMARSAGGQRYYVLDRIGG